MFRLLQHIKCVRVDEYAKDLEVGMLYAVEATVSGGERYGVKVYGFPKFYHHSYFRAHIGPVSVAAFASPLVESVI